MATPNKSGASKTTKTTVKIVAKGNTGGTSTAGLSGAYVSTQPRGGQTAAKITSIVKAAAAKPTEAIPIDPFIEELKKRSPNPITEKIMQNIRDARSASNAE